MGDLEYRSNDDLIAGLKERGEIKSERIERAFRVTPRATFLPSPDDAYFDQPWKRDNLHLSAPHIYSLAMTHLDIQPGMSFLNIGSGSGYLSCMMATLQGPASISHGLEFHSSNVDEARRNFNKWKTECGVPFCSIEFMCGNVWNLDPSKRSYDRMYVGAGCTRDRKDFLLSFVAPKGIAVIPCEGSIFKFTRGTMGFEQETIGKASFAQLQPPPSDKTLFSFPAPSAFPFVSGPWEGHFTKDTKRIEFTCSLTFEAKLTGKGTCSIGSFTVAGIYLGPTVRMQMNFDGPPNMDVILTAESTPSGAAVSGNWTTVSSSGTFSMHPGSASPEPTTPTSIISFVVRIVNTGNLQTVASSCGASVHHIKTELEKLESLIPATGNEFALVYNGKELPDCSSLVQCHFPPFACLYLIERHKHPKKGSSHTFEEKSITNKVCGYCGASFQTGLICADCHAIVHKSGACKKSYAEVFPCSSS